MEYLILILLVAAIGAIVLLFSKSKRTNGYGGADQQTSWTIGPVVNGENRSPRAHAVPYPEALIAVEIPHGIPGSDSVGDGAGELSGITRSYGSLSGKSRITARFRVEGDAEVRLLPSEPTHLTARATLFIQRSGDNWGALGDYQHYRWYTRPTVLEVGGEYEVSVELDSGWTSVFSGKQEDHPLAFRAALDNAQDIGIVFGGNFYAHGIYATGPARFVLIYFRVE
jgi:hypothetical protein